MPFPLCFLSKEETMSTSLRSQPTSEVIAPQPPRLLDQVAQAARQRGASEPTAAQLVAERWLDRLASGAAFDWG
jgi:hypothetical protein